MLKHPGPRWLLNFRFSDVLDCPIDIHTGGVDLKFPHHDNELAQAEVNIASFLYVMVLTSFPQAFRVGILPTWAISQ